MAILDEEADALAYAFSSALLTLNIERIYLAGHFGPDGGFLVERIKKALAHYLDRRFVHNISYKPIDDTGFLFGAAQLVLTDYFDYSMV